MTWEKNLDFQYYHNTTLPFVMSGIQKKLTTCTIPKCCNFSILLQICMYAQLLCNSDNNKLQVTWIVITRNCNDMIIMIDNYHFSAQHIAQ